MSKHPHRQRMGGGTGQTPVVTTPAMAPSRPVSEGVVPGDTQGPAASDTPPAPLHQPSPQPTVPAVDHTLPEALQQIHRIYLSSTEAFKSGGMSELELDAALAALGCEDATGAIWTIDRHGNFFRRATEAAKPTRAAPAEFRTAPEPAPFPERPAEPKRTPGRDAANAAGTALSAVGRAVGSAASGAAGMFRKVTGALRRPDGHHDTNREMASRKITPVAFAGLIGALLVLGYLMVGWWAPDEAPPAPLPSSGADPTEPAAGLSIYVPAVRNTAPYLDESAAHCVAENVEQTLNGRMKRPLGNDSLATVVASASPTADEVAALRNVVASSACGAVADHVVRYYAVSLSADETDCLLDRVVPLAESVLMQEIGGEHALSADTYRLRNGSTICASANLPDPSTPAGPDTGGDVLADIDGPTSEDARLVLIDLMTGNPNLVAARFADQSDLPSEGDMRSSAALFVGLRSAGAAGTLLEVDVDGENATQLVGMRIDGVDVGTLTIDWTNTTSGWRLGDWPEYKSNRR